MTRLDAKNLAKRLIKQRADIFLFLGCAFILYYSIVNILIENLIIKNTLELLAFPIFEYLYLYFSFYSINNKKCSYKSLRKNFSSRFYYMNLIILISFKFIFVLFELLEPSLIDFEIQNGVIGEIVVKLCFFTFVLIVLIAIYHLMFVPYILYDDNKITLKDAIKLSNNLLRGRKLKLLFLQLTFIGWVILSIILMALVLLIFKNVFIPYIVLAISFSFIAPYILITQTYYYDILINENKENKGIQNSTIFGSKYRFTIYQDIYDGSLITFQGLINLRNEEKQKGMEVYDTLDEWLKEKLKRFRPLEK